MSEVLLKMRFFCDGRVSSVLKSSCIAYTLRFSARCFLTLTKKSLFLEALLSLLVLQTATVQAAEIRDPMQPPAFALEKFRQAKFKNRTRSVKTGVKVKKPAVRPLRLTSILYSADRKIAIIDDRMLRVGDTIRNAKLIRIDRDSARLLKKGKFIELKLRSDLSAIKKTPRESRL